VATDSTGTDGIIEVMSDRLANQIAAGEVVQRPASVAKELLENALDAGASSLEVILKEAGSTLVQVIDDGCGMSRGDAARCFERHATSKIRSVDDLERIRTLGFRGEALASIAAVSQVTLKTKRVEDDAGTLVRVEGGEITENRPCAAPQGTSVAVRNLFYNVPARRNFLKTPATELKHLSTTVQVLALAHPRVAVRMEHDGHEHYDLAAAQSEEDHAALKERILGLFGDEHEEELVPIQDTSSDLTLHGFVGTPDYHRKTRGQQFLFVNDRYVRDRYLSHAVKKAYGDLLPDGTFPFFALYLDMDPRRVDVNVHPQKSEVKFDDQSGIYGFLRSAVREALGRVHVTPQFESEETGSSSSGDDGSDVAGGQTSRSGSASRPTSFQPRRSDSGSSEQSASASSAAPAPTDREQEGASPRRSSGDEPDAFGAASTALYQKPDGTNSKEGQTETDREERKTEDRARRPVWGLHDTYILTPTDTGLMMIDQRAAHVRVLYEEHRARLSAGQGPSQQLLFPHTVELTPSDSDLLEELLPDLRALGFEVERMSGRTVAVRGVPADVPDGDESRILEALLEQYKTEQDTVADERREHLARTLAQQSAVARGQPLSEEERRALLRDLFDCEMPYADPSGTPTIEKWSMEEIADRFGR
jgi:DNA mismatch repair protein MutL